MTDMTIDDPFRSGWLWLAGVCHHARIAGRTVPALRPRPTFRSWSSRSTRSPTVSTSSCGRTRRLPVVAVDLWYHVGPANEEKGRTGFAHLFEHMMFQARSTCPCDQHFQLLEAAGASDINGTTDFDRTNYFETLPSNQLELALWLESDRMGYLLDKVDQAALANQQDVVRNERRQSVENQPYGMAEEAVVQSLYPPGHPYYGNVIGSHEDIQAAKLDDVRRFFKQYYAPNNASLAIVGDIDVAQTKALVAEVLRHVEARRRPSRRSRRRRRRSPRSGARSCRRESSCRASTWPGSPRRSTSPATPTRTSRRRILGGGRSSRLYKKLVYEKQIAQNVSAPAVLADPGLDVPDRRHRASGPHRRGAREGARRGAGQRSARRRPTPPRSSARATPSRRTSSAGWRALAASAASPIA